MNKKSSYLLLYFLTAVVANWVTIEHEFDLCAMTIPGKYAAFHVNDEDWTTYSTSLMFISAETLKNDTSSATYNLTMWGCEFDCSFSFLIQLHKANSSVSVLTNNTVDNYSCLASNYTQNVIPTVNITHNDPKPNDQYIFSPLITLSYCARGIHPYYPGFQIDPAFNVHTCIDRLTGNDDGTYAANLHFGKGSSFSPDGWDVATYHLIDSANKLFDNWNTHHKALHDAFDDMSNKMNPENFKKLAPPPPPSHKSSAVGIIALSVVLGAMAAGATFAFVGGLLMEYGVIGKTAAEIAVEESVADTTNVCSIVAKVSRLEVMLDESQGTAEGETIETEMENVVDNNLPLIERFRADDLLDLPKKKSAFEMIKEYTDLYKSGNLDDIIRTLNENSLRIKSPSSLHKREAEGNDNIGVFSLSLKNHYFLSVAMTKLEEALSSGGYPDISTYLSGASENLLFHFNQTLYDNFFTANMSMINTFTGTQLIGGGQLIADDNEVYTGLRNSVYDTLTASILSGVLDTFKIVICDPAPSFCGTSCACGRGGCGGTWHCPRVGNDGCVMNIASSQLDELNSLRGSSDICSNNGTGWNITHNPSCSTKLFECINAGGVVLIPIGG